MSDNHVFKPYIGISGGLAISDNPFGWRPETGGRAALSLGAHIRFNPNDRFRAGLVIDAEGTFQAASTYWFAGGAPRLGLFLESDMHHGGSFLIRMQAGPLISTRIGVTGQVDLGYLFNEHVGLFFGFGGNHSTVDIPTSEYTAYDCDGASYHCDARTEHTASTRGIGSGHLNFGLLVFFR